MYYYYTCFHFRYNSKFWSTLKDISVQVSFCTILSEEKTDQFAEIKAGVRRRTYVPTTCTNTHTHTLELAGQPTARLPKRFSRAAGLIEKTLSASDVQCAPALLLSTATPLHPVPSIRRDFVSVTIYLFVYLLSLWDKNYISLLHSK